MLNFCQVVLPTLSHITFTKNLQGVIEDRKPVEFL